MGEQNVSITKASGEQVVFSREKLKNSLKRAGASDDDINRVSEAIEKRIYEGIPTRRIYSMAFRLLKKKSGHLAARYNLKRAIMDLGPTGFPFEKFVAEIMKRRGYEVKVGEIVQGHCVKHEIDVIAMKGNEHFMIECKFHNLPGTMCDVKIPLYIYSRFKDVEEVWVKQKGHESKFHQGWVVTNTKFSEDAVQYGTCSGLQLVGWNYPPKESLKELIDLFRFYPLTCLTSLTKYQKYFLVEHGIVLCSEVSSNKKILDQAGLSPEKINAVLDEAKKLSGQNITHG